MSHAYAVQVRPRQLHRLAPPVRPLSAELLSSAIDGLRVRQITSFDNGDQAIDVELARDSHEQALNEILIAVEQLGYSWLKASVTEWADNALAGAIFGCAGGGSVGASSGSGEAGLLGALLGLVVGAVIGSLIDHVKLIYELQWNGVAWTLVQVQPAPVAALPRLGLT